MVVGVVACGKAKRDAPAPAEQLYTSGLFRLSAEWTRTISEQWVILSALHGVLDPDMMIFPYQMSITAMPAAARAAWRRQVARQLADRFGPETLYVTTAGKPYREALPAGRTVCPWDEMPDMRFGKQMGWMKQQLTAPTWQPTASGRAA